MSIGFLIDDTARLFRRAFNAKTREHGITALQFRLMKYLGGQHAARQSDLAHRLEVEPISVSRMISRLVDADLAERLPDPADKRAKRIGLTPAAHRLLDSVAHIGEEIGAEATEGLTPEQCDDLRRLISKVRANLSRMPEPD